MVSDTLLLYLMAYVNCYIISTFTKNVGEIQYNRLAGNGAEQSRVSIKSVQKIYILLGV